MSKENSKKELISSMEKESFYDTTEDAEFALTPDSGVHEVSQMDPESKAKLHEEWTHELAKTEEEINTLRQVLSSRMRKQAELKRKLGITVWKEFKDDMEQGIRNIQDSAAYQKTTQTLKTAGEKTSEVFGTLGASVSKKLEEVKQSQTFKNIEDKVGTAYTNVKTKVNGSSNNQSGANGMKEEPLVEKSNGS